MATSFDRWEKDPFFPAAEEVQDSADRMESIYRQWIHSRKDSGESGDGDGYIVELQRELHLALGTAKWQLEEFDRAVNVSDETNSVGDDTKTRHSQFFSAIGDRMSAVENSLRESGMENLSWVRWDEGERDELARFLSWPVLERQEEVPISSVSDLSSSESNLAWMREDCSVEYSKKSCQSIESISMVLVEKKEHEHRRAASAAGDIGAWAVNIASEGEDTSESDDRPAVPVARVLSFSALTGSLEFSYGTKWYKNGFSKWRGRYQQDTTEILPLRSNRFSQDIDMCCHGSKSCLSSCEDDTYRKKLHGCLGTLQRLIQRSYYQIQYRRPILIIFWVSLLLLMIVLRVLHAS